MLPRVRTKRRYFDTFNFPAEVQKNILKKIVFPIFLQFVQFQSLDDFWSLSMVLFLFFNFGDGNWRQAEAWIMLLAGAVEVNALAQGALRQAIHSGRSPNLPSERRELYHWTIAAQLFFSTSIYQDQMTFAWHFIDFSPIFS